MHAIHSCGRSIGVSAIGLTSRKRAPRFIIAQIKNAIRHAGAVNMLFRLVYHSENHLGASNGKMIGDLNAIMDASNRNNEKAGITGALLFDTLWFVQILEGEREAVSATLSRIIGDERHDKITVMEGRPVKDRCFANWWMGLGVLRGDNSALYQRHGLGDTIDPRQLSGEQTVALACDLAKIGLNRRIASAAA